MKNIADYDVDLCGLSELVGRYADDPLYIFDSYDFSGKTVALFCTSGGSGLSDTVNAIKNLEPNAAVTEGLHIGSSSFVQPR